MSKKKEWSFKEVHEILYKFNKLAETGRYSSLAEIYNKLADDFKCSEEDVVSIFDTLNDDYEHLIKTQNAYETALQGIDTRSLPEKFKQLELEIKSNLRHGIGGTLEFLTNLKQWKKLYDGYNK